MDELLTLAKRLYARRQDGIVVPYKMVDETHREFECHQNAGTWARDNPGCRVVHGWMVFDHEKTSRGLVPLVNFNPHSVIETDGGERYDPTPSRASKRYPFLDHEGDPESFVRIVQGISLAILSYNPSADAYQVHLSVT
ncbi:hypothetical protein AB8Z38_11610 [Bradyrhizobium sp. LLZ17]|uniref:Uncharacterized protein n=1 Tax=Bradyrhizobium sp. LLZ17 TaxID=3239388 RepID=A0AB39XUM1_9BRAD